MLVETPLMLVLASWMMLVELPKVDQTRLTSSPMASTVKIRRVESSTATWATITCCVQLALLPQPSVAVQITRFVPALKQLEALLVTVVAPQLSLTTGLLNVTSQTQVITSGIVTLTSLGHVIEGGVVSTVHMCLFVQWGVSSEPSVTHHLRRRECTE